jgi:multiple sugar transport system permease protein
MTHERTRARLSDSIWGYLFAGPALALIGLLALMPILGALWLSLYRRLPIFAINEFVGGFNYVRLWEDDRFWAACRTTLYFTGLSVALELGIGLVLALLLDRLAGGREFPLRWVQVVIVVPWAVPTVVSAQMWGWLYHPEYGLLNYLLTTSGLVSESINWLADPAWAIHAAILMDVWKTTPFAALLLFAGMNAIPPDLYQAARVDGAGPWMQFRLITLPLLLPVILIVLVFRTMDAVRVFDAVYVLTGGGPGNSTETLSIYAYKMLFQTLQFGYGSTLATAMFVIVAGLTAVYVFLLRRHLTEAAG